MTGPILVLQHEHDVPLDLLGQRLADAGAELVVVQLGDEAIPDLARWSALVVLGGSMNVWQEDEHPWLADEKAAIRAWTAGRRRPLLGICLGHQLLADALGGEVGPRQVAEAGVRPVTLTPSGATDPLLGPLGGTFTSLQWHGAEVRTLPTGAVLLASNDQCAVQAMRVGPAAWGVQFHPEVGAAMAGEWGEHPELQALMAVADGQAVADRYPVALGDAVDELAGVTSRLADALVEQVRSCHPPS